MTKLKLFVWTGFESDYTAGLAFAIAKTENDARKSIIEKMGYGPCNWGELEIRDLSSPCAFYVTGGG